VSAALLRYQAKGGVFKMARSKLLVSIVVFVGVCMLAATGLAKTAQKKCSFNGNYSFFFWDPNTDMAGVGYFGVLVTPGSQCRSGLVLPGGIINCNFEHGTFFEDFIEQGAVFLETDGEGTMEIETASSAGICGTGDNALELDISVVQAGKTVMFSSDGEQYASSGTIPQAGYNYGFTGRADQCFAGSIAGCYDFHFWSGPQPDDVVFSAVGDCQMCLDNRGHVTSGTCRCNVAAASKPEYFSQIIGGGYTLGEDCQSSTGYLWFTTTSDEICGVEPSIALDFAVAQAGSEIIGACDPGQYVLHNNSLLNAGYNFSCAFEGYQQ
jgi:hypothetical protein